MTSSVTFNRGYTDNYMLLPLNRELNGMKVTLQQGSLEQTESTMNNLDDLRQADKDGNGILSLKELKNCKDKTEFTKLVEEAMEKFSNNPAKDYSKSLFEYWV